MTREEVVRNFKDIQIEEMITDLMVQGLGIPASLKGYAYIRESILMAVKDRDCVVSVTKCLYPTIARVHKTEAQKVERAIRHAIERSWENANPEYTEKIFGRNRGRRPTNSEYISAVADHLYMKMKKQVSMPA